VNMTGQDQRFGGSTSVSVIMRWLMDWIEMVRDFRSSSGAHQCHC
jgi:hypothetical protein